MSLVNAVSSNSPVPAPEGPGTKSELLRPRSPLAPTWLAAESWAVNLQIVSQKIMARLSAILAILLFFMQEEHHTLLGKKAG